MLILLYGIILGSRKQIGFKIGNNSTMFWRNNKVVDFITLINEVLEERNKTTKNLFEDGIISENTFYKYRNRYPNLKTLLKLANYLEVSVDYLFGLRDDNKFKPYSLEQKNLYNRIISLIESSGISQRKFSKDLNYSRVNLLRWKKGTNPNVQSLIEIAKYFNVLLDDLLDRS